MTKTDFRQQLQSLSAEKRNAVLDTLWEQRQAELRYAPRSAVLPISPAQQRLWYLAKAKEEDSSYNIPGFFKLKGRLSPEKLTQALTQLAERHEILRCRLIDEPPRMEIGESRVDLTVVDQEGSSIEEKAKAFVRLPFNLEKAPLWRALLIRQDEVASTLVLSFHHVIFDGWSLKVFIRELLAILDGQTLPPMTWQYPDYALWEQRRAQLRTQIDTLRRDDVTTPSLTASEQFWLTQLQDLPEPLELTPDLRSTVATGNGTLLVRELSSSTWQRLVDLGRSEGVTPFAAALAVFKLLLHRRTGESDLIVGTPVSGRVDAETQGLIGNFVNTIPLRTRVRPETTGREMLRSVSESSLQAFMHEDVAFDHIVELVNPVRFGQVHPIFQVLFAFQPALQLTSSAALEAEYHDLDFGTSKFDLSLDVVEDHGGVRLLFEYSTDRFHRQTIEDLAESYLAIVEGLTAQPDIPVGQLELLSEKQYQAALLRSQGEVVRPQFGSLLEAFLDCVELFSNGPALTASGRQFTYGELNTLSDEVAAKLIAAQPSARVIALLMPRTAELFSAILGVWKAGKACLILDPALPTERIETLLNDAEATLVTERLQLVEHFRLEQNGFPALILSELPQAALPALDVPQATDPAYIVYTSGSTGRPKGIQVSHGAYASMLSAWVDAFSLCQPTCLQLAASSFDVFYGDLARALGTGGHLEVVEPETAADPQQFEQLIRHRSVDFVEFVPSVFRRLALHFKAQGERLHIRHLVVASEGWSPEEGRAWKADVLSSESQLYNTYGVAEATVDSTFYRLSGHETGSHIPIGKPLPNTKVYVLDSARHLVATGTTGHILISGSGLSDGYIGHSAKENARFSSHSIAGQERLYDTGDMGYWTADGELVLVGRSDQQVKLRGIRIELSEIEQALRGLTDVQDAAVVVMGDPGQEQLIAWTVPADDVSPDLLAWRRSLAQKLPSFMVPEFALCTHIPYLPSGKVDRLRLKQRPLPRVQREHVAPRTPEETEMHRIFCDVLQRQHLSIYDNFFENGGHSLTALDLISKVRAAFGTHLRISELFNHPTVEQLTLRVGSIDSAQFIDESKVTRPDLETRYEPFPLTDVQQAYWLGRNDIFEFSGVATHSYDEFHVKHLDLERLIWSFNQIVKRHEMMRAIILPDGRQVILREVPEYHPHVYDYAQASQAAVDAHLSAVRNELSHQQIDMTFWPTFDLRVSLLPGDVQVLHFSTDALVLDAWSFVMIMRELSIIYDDVQLLPELEFSFRDYVLAEKASEGTEKFKRSHAYWAQRIPHLPGAPDLPMIRRPDDLKEPHFTRHHARLDKAHWERLKDLGAQRGLTPTSICLAAYAEILAQQVYEPHFCLNLTFLNRKPFHPQVDDIAGEFTSLTLLEVDQTQPASFLERALKIQQDLWETLEENEMSGVKVLREYARYHNAPTAAHFPVVFTSALAVPMPEFRPSFQVVHQPEHGVTQTSQVWLDAGIWEDKGDLRCNWDVVLDLYPAGLIERMFADYVALLTQLSQEPQRWEQKESRLALPAMVTEEVPKVTLLDLFLESRHRFPNRPAVIAPGWTLSYEELAQQAAGISVSLQQENVRSGELIGVYMDTGWEQVAAVVGIVAVAAYLPLSPELPRSRLQQIIQAANVRYVLTQPHLREQLDAAFDGTILTVSPELSHDELVLAGHQVNSRDLAYVIFTSGSTGTPKGVMIDHQGVVNTICDVNDRFHVDSDDRVLALSALSFDLSVYDIFGLLAAGGTIVMPEPSRRLDPHYQAQLVREHGVTIWNTVPALFTLFLGALEEPCTSLRLSLLSGDWIPLSLPADAQRLCPNAELHSLGGATEASIWSITYPIREVDPTWKSIPYGKGMRNQDIIVLDRELKPCAPWVIGDLYIRGVGLALGYWQDQTRTEEAFIYHPFDHERLYRTGDLGRLLPDGNIEFLGRSDFQLKISGYRVEAGEVERAALRHEGVKEVLVMALGEGLADKRLACLWVPNEIAESEFDLRAFLSTVLPPYMVPLIYARVDALPLSSNGKIDRKAVQRLFGHLEVASAHYVAPTTPDERRMVELWTNVLRRNDIGIHDDFFQIGGNSIAAIALLTELRREFTSRIALGDIYNARTPTNLLKAVIKEVSV